MKVKQQQTLLHLGLVLVVGVVAGILIAKDSSFLSTSLQSGNSDTSNGTVAINMTGSTADFFTGQVTAPTSYFATDDNMLISFDSQGGMGPPRLILMKNRQVLGSDSYFDIVTEETIDDCIVIWSTNGMDYIEAWVNGNILDYAGELTDEEVIPIGTRSATLYTAADRYVGLLPIGNEEDTSYFFHTCNLNNKADFINVMKSLKLRQDINFGQTF